jgi:hypothetical protein
VWIIRGSLSLHPLDGVWCRDAMSDAMRCEARRCEARRGEETRGLCTENENGGRTWRERRLVASDAMAAVMDASPSPSASQFLYHRWQAVASVAVHHRGRVWITALLQHPHTHPDYDFDGVRTPHQLLSELQQMQINLSYWLNLLETSTVIEWTPVRVQQQQQQQLQHQQQ